MNRRFNLLWPTWILTDFSSKNAGLSNFKDIWGIEWYTKRVARHPKRSFKVTLHITPFLPMTFHLLLFAKSHQTSCRNVQRRDWLFSLVCCNLHSKCKQNFTGGKKKDAAWMWRWSGYCFYLLFAFWESQTYFARLHNSPETTHTYIHTYIT